MWQGKKRTAYRPPSGWGAGAYTVDAVANGMVAILSVGVAGGSGGLDKVFRHEVEVPVSSVCAGYIGSGPTAAGLIDSLSVPLPVATKEGVSTGPADVIYTTTPTSNGYVGSGAKVDKCRVGSGANICSTVVETTTPGLVADKVEPVRVSGAISVPLIGDFLKPKTFLTLSVTYSRPRFGFRAPSKVISSVYYPANSW